MMSWQLMSDAPRDGTIIIARRSDDSLAGYSSGVRESRRYCLARFVGWWEAGWPGGHAHGGGDNQFTGWAHLPHEEGMNK